MDQVTLKVQMRDAETKAKALRRKGLLPAEYYGKGVKNLSIQMDYQSFRRMYRHAGDNTLIDMDIEGQGKKKVLVQNVDYDPVSGEFIHVDFINVDMDVKVTANVPVVLEGTAPAVKEQGGILTQNLDEIEIRCLPANLIHEVKLSVESLVDFHSAIHVSDIKLDDKIEILTDPSITIATVSAPRSEEVESGEDVDVSAVEVPSASKEGE